MNGFSIFMKAFVAIVCFSVTYLIVEGWIGILLGLLFGALSLILIGMLTNESDKKEICRVDERVNRFSRLKLLFPVLVCVVSISSFYFVLPMQNQVYIPPENILLVNWVRLVCVILMTTFVPGYLILDMVDLQAIRGLNKVLFSYILSIFSTFLLGYIIILSGNSINQLGTFGISIFNVSLLMVYLFFLFRRRLGNRQSQEANYFKSVHLLDDRKLYTAAFWILMICFIVVLTYVRYGTQIIADQRGYHGLAISLESIKLPQDASAFPSSVPWLFGVYLAMLFGSSGIPSINAYNSLNFLNIMPIIAFFVLIKSFFKNRPHSDFIAVLCTFFAFLTSGFGWIYTLRDTLIGNVPLSEAIYLSWTKTYDILTPNSYITAAHPDITTPLLLIGLPAMFVLFELVVSAQNELGTRLKYFLIILTAVFAYLGHTETIIMIVTVAIISITKKDSLKVLISLLVAFLAIFVIDALSPSHFYSTQGVTLLGHFVSFPILLSSALVGLICICLVLRMVKSANLLARLRSMVKRAEGSSTTGYLVVLFSSVIFCIYLLTFVIWGNVQANFNTWLVFGYDGSVPWYFYPMRLGVIGFIALTGTLYWLLTKRWSSILQLFPFYLWAFVAIIVGPYYLEYRLLKELYIPISIIAGITLLTAAKKVSTSSILVTLEHGYEAAVQPTHKISGVRINGKHLVAIGLLAIVITSIGSNLLSIRAFSDPQVYPSVSSVLEYREPFTEEELAALSWLKLHINPMTDTVLSLPDGRNLFSEVEDIGGAWAARSENYAPFFEVSRADDFFDLCNEMHATYLYLNWKDREILNSTEYANSFVNQLLNYFQVVFNNSKVTIYKFPNFAAPSHSSSTAFVLPSDTLPITTVALSGLNYSVITEDDPAISSYNTLILPSYPSAEELANYTEWLEQGGNLVILSFPPDPSLERSYGAINGTFYGLTPLYGNWSAVDNEILSSASGEILGNERIVGNYSVSTYVHALQALDPENNLGLLFNYQDDNNYYYAFLRDDALFVLAKEVNGTSSEVFHATTEESNEPFRKLTVQLSYSGPALVLRFYVDSAYVGEYSDSQPIMSGRLGLRTYQTTGQFLAINVTLAPSKYVSANGIAGENTAINMPEIEVPLINETMLLTETTSVDAYYTMNGKKVLPFAFTMATGKGTVTSIDFPPLFNFMEDSSSQESEQSLFSNLGSFFDLVGMNLPTQQTATNMSVQQIPYIIGTLNSTGKVTVQTDSFWLMDQKPLFGTIDLSNATAFRIIEGSTVLPTSRQFNATILGYQAAGSVKSTIQTSNITIEPADSGVYATAEIPDNFRLVDDLANNATVNLTLSVDNSTVKLSVMGGSVGIETFNVWNSEIANNESNLQICAKYPELRLNGSTFMEQAYLSTSPYSALVAGFPVVVSGLTAFQIESVDQGIIRISNLLVNGELSPKKPGATWNEWDIPWTQILTSADNLLFVALIIMFVLLFAKVFSSSKRRACSIAELRQKEVQELVKLGQLLKVEAEAGKVTEALAVKEARLDKLDSEIAEKQVQIQSLQQRRAKLKSNWESMVTQPSCCLARALTY